MLPTAVTLLLASSVVGGVVQVGPSRTYKTVESGYAAANAGDTIEIDAGNYPSTAFKIAKSNLTFRGVGGRPHLSYSGNIPNDKGILVVEDPTVHDLVVDNLEISGATGSSGNAAAIRYQGKNLTVRGCYLHHSQNGILEGHGDVSGSIVTVEFSELAFNGVANSGYEHNMYISASVQKLTLRYSYSHHAKEGHLVKSRALENYIIANRIVDEDPVNDGGTTDQSSAVIDLPQGGRGFIIGNMLHKGSASQNKNAAIWYARENGANAPHELYVVNNTYVSDTGSNGTAMILAERADIIFVANNLSLGDGRTLLMFNAAEDTDGREISAINNFVDDDLTNLVTYAGSALVPSGIAATSSGNRKISDAKLVNRDGFDWHLAEGSMAIDNGIDPGSARGFALAPTAQYVHTANAETRSEVGPTDVGAFERGGHESPITDPTTGDGDGDGGGGEGTGTGGQDGGTGSGSNPGNAPGVTQGAGTGDGPAGTMTNAGMENGANVEGTCAQVGSSSWLTLAALFAIAFAHRQRRSR